MKMEQNLHPKPSQNYALTWQGEMLDDAISTVRPSLVRAFSDHLGTARLSTRCPGLDCILHFDRRHAPRFL